MIPMLMSMLGSGMGSEMAGEAQGLMGSKMGNVQAVDPQTALNQTNAGAQIQQVPMWMGGQAPQMPNQPVERQHTAFAGMSGLAPMMQQQQMPPPQMAPPQMAPPPQQSNPNDWYQRDLQEFIRQDMMPRGIM